MMIPVLFFNDIDGIKTIQSTVIYPLSQLNLLILNLHRRSVDVAAKAYHLKFTSIGTSYYATVA